MKIRETLLRQASLVEQELLNFLEHLSSPPVFRGVCVTRSLIFSFICMFCWSLFVLFLLAIVLCVLLRYMDSDCLLGILKLFFKAINTYFKIFGFTRLRINPIYVTKREANIWIWLFIRRHVCQFGWNRNNQKLFEYLYSIYSTQREK